MADDMYTVSLSHLVVPVLALFGIFLVTYVLLIMLAMGPIGWILTFVLGFGVSKVYTKWKGESASQPQRINCIECGYPNTPDSTACDYCHTTLS